jgi:uncharacterized RDD family membrane protein YckC
MLKARLRRRRTSDPPSGSRPDLETLLRGAGLRVAPMRRRILAWMLDVLLFVVPAAALIYLTGGLDLMLRAVREIAGRELGIVSSAASLPGSNLAGAHTTWSEALLLIGVVVVFGAAWVTTRIVATARYGRTPGKWCFGLRVVDATNPMAPPSLAKAALRWLIPQLSGAVPLPGTGLLVYSPALRDRWLRGLHDRAAGTIVVDARVRRCALGGGAAPA